MRRRLYYLLPDLPSARKTMDDLLLARIEERHIHFLAKRGTSMDGLHEANILQKSDIVHGAQRGVLIGAALGCVLGFVITFIVGLYLALATPADIATKVPAAMGEANTLRVVFFILTFFSIGVLSNFKKLWQEGIGKLAAVYVLSLFGFVIWVGLLISWLFFAGVKPPLAS